MKDFEKNTELLQSEVFKKMGEVLALAYEDRTMTDEAIVEKTGNYFTVEEVANYRKKFYEKVDAEK